MKFTSIIDSLPTFTQVSVLYTVLGSLNTSAINSAQRKVAKEIRDLERAGHTRNVISIDKYNELMNDFKAKEQATAHVEEVGFETPAEKDYLGLTLTLRAPLLAMFNAAQAKLPNREGAPADFSFEESLARSIAREFSVQEAADKQLEEELIASGAITREELELADKTKFENDKAFKQEFKFLILDKLHEAEPFEASIEDGDEAFMELGEEYQRRLILRILPKLHEAKMQNLSRRSYDPDASTNVLLIGLAQNEMKKFIGDSESDAKLKKMQALMAAA